MDPEYFIMSTKQPLHASLSAIATPRRFDTLSPLRYLTRRIYLYFASHSQISTSQSSPLRVVCISDTHNRTTIIPDGDILIHAGDLSDNGTISEIQAQIDWLASLPHTHKIAIAGNHDSWLDPEIRTKLPVIEQEGSLDWKSVRYVQSEAVTLEVGKRAWNIYAAPHVPYCGSNSFAFQYQRHSPPWKKTPACHIPADTDILITHTPPRFHQDLASSDSRHLGCKALLEEVWRVRPKLHVFGHVHASRGMSLVRWDYGQKAYERTCLRKDAGLLELLDLWAWIDLSIVVVCGFSREVNNVLRRNTGQESIMVNAAVWTDSHGHLEYPIQVAEL
ncbi:Metallo-dependent phosphatase [Lophiostoma macrostomum CBS 122681]|uniref:Metallo-dependent phosphatase n=1 Tax=Lophiostoma macrostomum CBS 122681 TaxID=1314788 RepID=A0A6A6T757_9PLEO|nr:Metallo-dependent phosphatase [Lophiostoma macrostomum CBS 122681]